MTRIAAVALALFAGACISSYQSPRMLDTGQTRITGTVSNIRAEEGGDDESGGEAVDVIVNHGVADNVELVGRYGHLGDAHGALFGAKVSLVPDRLAVLLPAGPIWGYDGSDGAEYGGIVAQPELIGGTPLGANAELTGAIKLSWVSPDEGESESMLGADVGVRLSTDLDAWAIHPSIGFLDTPEDGYLLSLGVGLAFTH